MLVPGQDGYHVLLCETMKGKEQPRELKRWKGARADTMMMMMAHSRLQFQLQTSSGLSCAIHRFFVPVIQVSLPRMAQFWLVS